MEFAKEIINLGIKFFIIQIACLAIYQTINIIISHVAGPESVTEYNVIYKYLSIPLMVFNIIMGPIWSAYTDAYTLNDFEWMKTIYHKLIKLLMITMICLVVMIAFYRIFFNIWLGGKVQIHLSIVLIIGIYISTTLWNNVHSYIINGTGKIKLQLYVSLIGTFLNIPFSLLLGKYYGVLGVIIPVIIFSLIPAIILKIQTNKMLNNNLSGIWAE
jgi:O-antigen/teichoic acid export membrane protein